MQPVRATLHSLSTPSSLTASLKASRTLKAPKGTQPLEQQTLIRYLYAL